MPFKSVADMPAVGLGLWKVPQAECAEVVYQAIKAGYRLLDGASDYGNEVEAGQGLKRAIDEGLVKREDVWVTTKLWNTFHKAEHVATNARRQLKDWGLDYFDAYLIHFPISLKYGEMILLSTLGKTPLKNFLSAVDPATRYPPGWTNPAGETEIEDTPIQETWQALELLHAQGLVHHIGVSNFMATLLMDVLRYAKVKPSILQVEMHPYLVQRELLAFLVWTSEVTLPSFANLLDRLLIGLREQSWIELDHPKVSLKPLLLVHDVIEGLGKLHKKSPAQVLLRWATQRGIAVIPKSTNTARLIENLDSTTFDLSAGELETISKLDIGLRFNNPAAIDPRISIFS
ncbi:hypothetical protein RQP46_007171 [Phenoliferia psychrophenolica]